MSTPVPEPGAPRASAPDAPMADAGDGDDGWSRAQLAILLLITVFAGMIRLWRIEIWSVSAAEAATWQAVTQARPEGLSWISSGLRLLLESEVLPSFGEGWLRLPFAFFGLLAVPLLALVGAPFVGRLPALLAAGMLAVHPWHIEQSQSAVGAGVALTLGLLAGGAAHAAARQRSLPLLLLAVACGLAAGSSHRGGLWFGHIVLVGVALGAVSPTRGAARYRWLGVAVALLATIGVMWWLRAPGAAAVGVLAVARTLGSALAIASMPVLVAAVIPLLGGGVELRPRRYLLAGVLTPAVVVVTLGLLVLPVRVADLLLALPPLLLLAAVGVTAGFAQLWRALGGERSLVALVSSTLLAIVVLLDLGVGTFLQATAGRGGRPDWRAARDVVIHRAGQGDLAVLVGEGLPSLLYYLRPNHWRDDAIDPHPGIAVVPVAPAAPQLAVFLTAARDRGGDLFFVLSENEMQDLRRNAAEHDLLEAEFRLLAVLPCQGRRQDQTVYVYRLRPIL